MNIQNFLSVLTAVFEDMQINSLFALKAAGFLWSVQLLNFIVFYKLNVLLGLYPRKIRGLAGIFCMPFLHGSFAHVFFNSIPLFVLLDFMRMNGLSACMEISFFILFASGFLLWLFGRRGIHIGASSLIMGYFAYLLVNAYQHFSVKSVLLSFICLYYFGGLIFSLFPQEERISWEGHVLGFISGLGAAFLN